MSEISPSIADSNIIRTYSNDYAQSDTESEGEAQFEVDSENEELHSIHTRLQQNQLYMDQQITTPSSDWILEPQTWNTTKDTQVVLIRKPTASNLSHRLLNPFIYRNIQNAGTLNDLAILLNTPDDWEMRYNQAVADGYIIEYMNDFRNLPDNTLEADIQINFGGIVEAIARSLLVHIRPKSETKIIVGGILARYQYDLRSKTDPHFHNTSGLNLIASEVKTHRTFAPGEMWYHGSRGIQVLSALYAYNCPTFLFTHKQWKLFVENNDRNAILTFPYNNINDHTAHVNSSLVHPMGTTFLKAIVICLLSRRVSLDESMKALSIEESSQVKETPKKTVIKPKYFDTPDKPKRQSARLQLATNMESGKKIPSFVSGYDVEGQPIYTIVRVVPQEIVSRIEDEISEKERKEFQNQTSEMTLID